MYSEMYKILNIIIKKYLKNLNNWIAAKIIQEEIKLSKYIFTMQCVIPSFKYVEYVIYIFIKPGNLSFKKDLHDKGSVYINKVTL